MAKRTPPPPALLGLLQQLPTDGWTVERRAEFLYAFTLVLDISVPVTSMNPKDPTSLRQVSDGGNVTVERHISRRCPKMREHGTFRNGHRLLPIPCDECYSIESYWRRIPYEPDSTTPDVTYPEDPNAGPRAGADS